MSSDTAIANEALVQIGNRSSIASLDEESNEARTIKRFYASTRDEVLQMAFWGFAKKVAALAVLKSAPGTPGNTAVATAWTSAYPAPPWQFEYAYPSDCLRMRSIVPQTSTGYTGAVPIFSNQQSTYPYVLGPAMFFEIGYDADDNENQRQVILTNSYQALGCYTVRVTNSGLFSPLFSNALSSALGAKIAFSLTGDANLTKLLYAMANQFIIDARAADGNQGLERIDQEAAWILAREGGLPNIGSEYVMPYAPLYMV